MITGSLKKKVDAIRNDFYNENKAQSSDVVNQLTMLMFIKMLDDKQSALEAQAAVLNIKPDPKDLIFKTGDYKFYEKSEGDEKPRLKFKIPYENLRWKNFKNLNADQMAILIRDYVIPFIKDPNNTAVGKFAEYSKEYTFGFETKRRLLEKVVDKLSDPEFNFTNGDLMGDVYEYICGTGISGQYRTPRHIIDMAVEMMKPKLGEKIIDPAMGTAGFLVESAKYIKDNQKSELLNSNKKKMFTDEMFYGCDNDDNMARIGYMNAILHGIKNPNFTMDSLLEGENATNLLEKFDLVLANPPFSGKLVESATSGQILSITKTKQTELLFVALMDMLLKVGGRCMTIVPDGVLYGTDNAHKQLRVELIERQKLIAVISMPTGIFMAPSKKGSASKGAGVKTSFLIFEKTTKFNEKAKKCYTENVWFYCMDNDGFTLNSKRDPIEGSNIPDIINRYKNLSEEFERTRKNQSFMVPVSEIRENDYNLTFNKYKAHEIVKKSFVPSIDIFKQIESNSNELSKQLSELKEILCDEK